MIKVWNRHGFWTLAYPESLKRTGVPVDAIGKAPVCIHYADGEPWAWARLASPSDIARANELQIQPGDWVDY